MDGISMGLLRQNEKSSESDFSEWDSYGKSWWNIGISSNKHRDLLVKDMGYLNIYIYN